MLSPTACNAGLTGRTRWGGVSEVRWQPVWVHHYAGAMHSDRLSLSLRVRVHVSRSISHQPLRISTPSTHHHVPLIRQRSVLHLQHRLIVPGSSRSRRSSQGDRGQLADSLSSRLRSCSPHRLLARWTCESLPGHILLSVSYLRLALFRPSQLFQVRPNPAQADSLARCPPS